MSIDCDFKVGDTIYKIVDGYDAVSKKRIRMVDDSTMYIITSISVGGSPSISNNYRDIDIVYVAGIRDVRKTSGEDSIFIQSNPYNGAKEVYAVKTASNTINNVIIISKTKV